MGRADGGDGGGSEGENGDGVSNGIGGYGGDIGRGNECFIPGPWLVFHVRREDYVEFYIRQAKSLDLVVRGLCAEDMLC